MYDIPINIRELEFENDTSSAGIYKEIKQKIRSDEASYISLMTAMIHMEEAANSKGVKKYDLHNIRFTLHSFIDRLFKVKYDVR